MNSQQINNITKALEFLEMFVVSLDRIGSYSASSQLDSSKLLESFVEEYDVYKNAAEAREALSQFFDDDIPDGEEESELEKVLKNVKYWSPRDN